jgi:hypothetical protein
MKDMLSFIQKAADNYYVLEIFGQDLIVLV